MEPINFTHPIDVQYAFEELETALAQAVKQVFIDELSTQMQDLVDYGCPHLGSRTVIDRFTKQDGLVVLRRPVTSDTLMRVIYANWSSLGSERGLGLIEFMLRMLWPDQWQIVRLWHSIPKVSQYPRFLSSTQQANHFLTSRINISLAASVDLKEIAELSPIIRRLVPANMVVKVIAEALNVDFDTQQIQAAVIGKMYQVVDLS